MSFLIKRLVETLNRNTNCANGCTCFSSINGLTRHYSYKSVYALENLYPKSCSNLVTPEFRPEDSSKKFSGFIPIDKLTITCSHSSGPGGQNVNSVNSKVDLRFQVQTATWLNDEIKEKLLVQERNKINKNGFLVVKSEVTRYQHLNLADAIEKLRVMIRKAVPQEHTTSLETEEKIKKREIKATRERIYQKRMRSQIKQDRNISF